ncbi:hypothetical protein G7Y79_00025g056850 [Physcia stellaris]|nr:hypothetical protein G7Y79_00025g056850 [Physcia stellaris]
MSPTPKLVVEAVSYILKRDDSLATFIGKSWFTRFFKRNPQLTVYYVEEVKYISPDSPVPGVPGASVQQPEIDEEKSENEEKEYLLDENVMRLNELIAVMTHYHS